MFRVYHIRKYDTSAIPVDKRERGMAEVWQSVSGATLRGAVGLAYLPYHII